MTPTGCSAGSAYAVGIGVGAVGTAALGIVLYCEPATVGRLPPPFTKTRNSGGIECSVT
jgi:hypothetical protein